MMTYLNKYIYKLNIFKIYNNSKIIKIKSQENEEKKINSIEIIFQIC